jgi:hypothetical protein
MKCAYPVISHQRYYFVKHQSDSKYKYSTVEIKRRWNSNNPLAFLWALILLLYWQTYCYIHIRQTLFTNCFEIVTKKLAVSFNHTFRYIDDVLSINNHNFHNYVHLIYPKELDSTYPNEPEIKDTTVSSTFASYLDVLLKLGIVLVLHFNPCVKPSAGVLQAQ